MDLVPEGRSGRAPASQPAGRSPSPSPVAVLSCFWRVWLGAHTYIHTAPLHPAATLCGPLLRLVSCPGPTLMLPFPSFFLGNLLQRSPRQTVSERPAAAAPNSPSTPFCFRNTTPPARRSHLPS